MQTSISYRVLAGSCSARLEVQKSARCITESSDQSIYTKRALHDPAHIWYSTRTYKLQLVQRGKWHSSASPTFMNHSRLRIFLNLGRQTSSRSYFRQANASNHSRWKSTGRRTAIGASVVAGTTLALSTVTDDGRPKQEATLGSLIRTYAVYTMCSFPSLVDASPKILSVMSSVPGLRQITEGFVRITFFDQFVGADTAEDALPLLRSLRSTKKGVLFAYSVEVDEDEATGGSDSISTGNTASNNRPAEEPSFMRLVDETIHCIDVAADFETEVSADGSQGRRTWIAVKMTALLPNAHALIALSSHITESRKTLPKSFKEAAVPFPGSPRIDDLDVIVHEKQSASPASLSLTDINDLKRLYADLSRICAHAKAKGIKIIVDAEYSWYQPAIDALTLALMREFNCREKSGNVQPLVYGTFQCYLRRTPGQLALAIEDSRKHNYALGVKLVRGAYHPHELAAHEAAIEFDKSGLRTSLSISPDGEPPVWQEKRDTDYAYNQCVKLLIGVVSQDVARTSITNVADSKGAWGWSKLWWGVKTISSGPVPPVNSIPKIGVLFGTHNWESCALIVEELLRSGLAVNDPDVEGGIKVGSDTIERIAVGQLYGMCDDLTDWVVSKVSSTTPFVIKYVPYGALAEVMPYLGRRAIENKSVLGEGHAQHERERAAKEIKKRIFG